MSDEVKISIRVCPKCGADMETDNDVTWCTVCDYAYSNAARSVRARRGIEAAKRREKEKEESFFSKWEKVIKAQ